MGVATWTTWISVAALIAGMWLAMVLDHEQLAVVMGFTACAGSAVAGTLHIRQFICRTQRMVRTLLVRDMPDREVIRPLR